MAINQEQLVNTMAKCNLSTVTDFCKLVAINIGVQGKNFWEYLKVVAKFYPSWKFFKADFALQSMYLFNNPFSISKRFLMNRGDEDVYAYGETPLTTLEVIVKECRVKPGETVFELGSGRGRTCFWLNCYYGCNVVGIEQVPDFVQRANLIATKLNISGIEFRQEDMLDSNLAGANTVYLYGTCLEDSFIEKLTEKLETLPSGTKIITVSYPLTEYTDSKKFEIMKRFPAKFTWGTADVYLQVIK